MSQQQSALTPEQQKQIDQLTKDVAAELSGGVPREAIISKLMGQGFEKAWCEQFVDYVRQLVHEVPFAPPTEYQVAEKYRKHMIYGAMWCIGGALVTFLTYSAAKGGGTYVVAWGAMIFGVVDFTRGFVGWQKHNQLAAAEYSQSSSRFPSGS